MRSRPELRWRRSWLAAVAFIAMLAVSCGDGEDASDRTVVEVFGPIVDGPGQRLGGLLREISADSNVELRYVGVTSFNEQLEDRLQRGDRPGVALLPQPGRLEDLAARGVLEPLPADLVHDMRGRYPAALVDLITIDGSPAAVWLTIDLKGLVWYQPAAFAEAGLEVPSTLDGLAELSERMRSEGGIAPWCLTMEAGASTGWVGTDWVESYVLRMLGTEQYDRWTAGTLRFDSPAIASVLEELDGLLRQPGALAGGARSALATPWERSAALLLEPSPTCLMAHQADFIRREFPTGTQIGPDGQVDFFVLPTADGVSPPLLVGGTLAAPLGDGDAVATAMELLATPELAEGLARTGDFLSPHLGIDAGSVTDATSRRLIDLLLSTTTLRFDGSDLMPPAVGSGTFWTGMRAFLAGEQVDTVLADIQAGWSVR